MRRTPAAGMIMCALLSVLASCSEETPTEATQGSPTLAATAAPSCNPHGHPGKIVDNVTAPSPWGVTVRDAGLAWFTEVFDNAIGFTSTRTRKLAGSGPSGPIPTGIVSSPGAGPADVASQLVAG